MHSEKIEDQTVVVKISQKLLEKHQKISTEEMIRAAKNLNDFALKHEVIIK